MTQGVAAVRWFEDLGPEDAMEVGGKNASLGDMARTLRQQGIRVPDGFATTASAYTQFLELTGLDHQIAPLLQELDSGAASIKKTGAAIRELLDQSELPAELADSIRAAYRELGRRHGKRDLAVAIRCTLTNDAPIDGFPGQIQSFLSVRGEDEVLDACLKCYTSVFTDRAIAYREEKQLDHMQVALSVAVQWMVRSDNAGSGVVRTWDLESGFPRVVVIE